MIHHPSPKVLGIIPARGGSKSIPRKNVKSFCGKPLIAWKIEAATQSGIFDRIIVSTDDAEIAETARHYGAEIPFMRPAELAQDSTPTLPVIAHAVRFLEENQNYRVSAVMLLEPTSPGVRPFHIRGAMEVFLKTGSDSVVSVVETPAMYHPSWAFSLGNDLRTTLFLGGHVRTRIKRRQDLPKVYAPNGGIYLFRPALLFNGENASLYGDDVRGYVMDERYSVDIDTPEDWKRGELAMRELVVRETT
ncbi:MAG: acylneuraminate cytidylyltransferase family protein [Patescibacteria group bacterium]